MKNYHKTFLKNMAKKKIRILLSGSSTKEIREQFVSHCFQYGRRVIIFTDKQNNADLVVDITLFNATTDLRAEAEFTVATAKQAQTLNSDLKTLKKIQHGSK